MHALEDPRLCPHCGNVAPHEVLFKCHAPQIWYSRDGTASSEGQPGLDFALLRCLTCKEISLHSKLDELGWECGELEYPANYDLDRCVPHAVAENYREAKRVQSMSPNAFAVLLRRALEALCNDRGVEKGTLAARLKELSSRGEIPEKLSEISSVLRVLGNAGAHHTTQKVTVPLTWTMDGFFRTLIEYVYVAPHKLAKFQSSLEKYEKANKPQHPTA